MAPKNNRISGNYVPLCFLSGSLRVLENSLNSGQGKLSQKPSATFGKNVSRNQKNQIWHHFNFDLLQNPQA